MGLDRWLLDRLGRLPGRGALRGRFGLGFHGGGLTGAGTLNRQLVERPLRVVERAIADLPLVPRSLPCLLRVFPGETGIRPEQVSEECRLARLLGGDRHVCVSTWIW